jgi:hypothetical protein
MLHSVALNCWVRMLAKIDQQIADNERAILQLISGSELHRRVDDLAILHDLKTRIENKIANCQQ